VNLLDREIVRVSGFQLSREVIGGGV